MALGCRCGLHWRLATRTRVRLRRQLPGKQVRRESGCSGNGSSPWIGKQQDGLSTHGGGRQSCSLAEVRRVLEASRANVQRVARWHSRLHKLPTPRTYAATSGSPSLAPSVVARIANQWARVQLLVVTGAQPRGDNRSTAFRPKAVGFCEFAAFLRCPDLGFVPVGVIQFHPTGGAARGDCRGTDSRDLLSR